MTQPVSDVASSPAENIAHAAEVIGRSDHRRRVFSGIYTGKAKLKSVTGLMATTKLERTRVLDAGKKLVDNRICNAVKLNGETHYEKIGFYQQRKKKILTLAASKKALNEFPTKRNPKVTTQIVRVVTSRSNVRFISIDDVDSFNKVRRVKSTDSLEDTLSETRFKRGVQKILGQGGIFKDWGGETADLITTRVVIKGRRVPAAFAFKGPGTKGKLTVAKMGKNGDQVQRLLEAPAEVFFVQYCRGIEPSVLTELKQMAMAKSQMAAGNKILYGIIDGQDSRRLTVAYPSAFKKP